MDLGTNILIVVILALVLVIPTITWSNRTYEKQHPDEKIISEPKLKKMEAEHVKGAQHAAQ